MSRAASHKAARRPRFVVAGFEGRGLRRRVRIYDRSHKRYISVLAQGNRLLIYDRHHDRPKQAVQNPTLRKVAMEALS